MHLFDFCHAIQIYSRTLLTQTLQGNEKLLELAGVRVSEVGVKFRLLVFFVY